MSTSESQRPDEISISEFVKKSRSLFIYLKKRWRLSISVGILGAVIGFCFALISKPKYTATSTFVLEESSKGGGLGQYIGLAAMAGIDLGGMSNSGIFQGDNILELYKSRTMIEKALLSTGIFNGKKQLLIDRYIEFNNWKENWAKDKILADLTFNGNPEKFNRRQDSIISAIVVLFNKKVLLVTKPDKKISIIKVDVTTDDEEFAQKFNLKLVEVVNDFYTQTKTKKSSQNVKILEHQTDSVKSVLNRSIYGVASALDDAPNANPAMQILKAPSQRKQVDVQASSAIYTELVKNLELSKMSLRQETPLIQIIDLPVIPLSVAKTGKIFTTVVGFIVGAVLCMVYLTAKKVFANL